MKGFWKRHAEIIRCWLTHRHLPIMLACAGMLLASPALLTGLVFDDYVHRDMLSENRIWPPIQDASLLGLFSFADGTAEGTQALFWHTSGCLILPDHVQGRIYGIVCGPSGRTHIAALLPYVFNNASTVASMLLDGFSMALLVVSSSNPSL